MNAPLALVRFARERLVPLSRDHFADERHGGFHERLSPQLAPIATGRKRLMVQARQLYLLSHAGALGDRSGENAVQRGYDFLLRNFRDPVHGGWYFAVTPEGDVLDAQKDLYGHAFVLFALAWLHRVFAAPGALTLAAETMDLLHRHAAVAGGGFHDVGARDWAQTSDVLRQNPHMHLLEAVLALHEASGDDRWLLEARDLVTLFHDRLFHRQTGTLREFFAGDWTAHPDQGDVIEPGHQFEWVWLLHQYRKQGGTLPIDREAESLFRFGIKYGFDPEHGGIHDQVGPDGGPQLSTRRIWPVTEAIKACIAVTEAGRDHRADAERLCAQLMEQFILPEEPRWLETLTREGQPTMTDLPGSTPYHIFLAASEAHRFLLA